MELEDIHGTAEDPTVIAAINRWGAKITLSGAPQWGNTLVAMNCSYLEIDGLEVYGADPNLGTGIQASDESHHVTIRNCFVHDCGCNGISARGSDYITVEKNILRDNAKRSEWNCSGISFLLAKEFDQEPDYHMVIRQNIAFENECRLPFAPGGFDTPTDGNGIILDLFNNPYSDDEGQTGGYKSSTLIENNLSFNNGGRGIHIFSSDYVTIRNNTCWHNLFVLAEYDQWKGDIETFESESLQFYNNISIQNPDQPTQAMRMYDTDNDSKVYNNMIVGIKDFWPQRPKERNNIVREAVDQDYPELNNPTTEIEFNVPADFGNYFGLKETSPAINAGYNKAAPYLDIDSLSRLACNDADIGAYEFIPVSDTVPLVYISTPEDDAIFYSDEEIPIEIIAAYCGGAISLVELYEGETLLKEFTSEPYSYSISNAGVGRHRYRALVTDSDDKITESELLLIQVIERPSDISDIMDQELVIYPNPASALLNVYAETDCKILVHDMLGKLFLSKDHLSGLEQIDVSMLTQGIYNLSIIDNQTIFQSRFIIE